MKRMIILLVVGLMLLLPARSQAQSGGGYDLSWATVDGGGGAWSAGGAFELAGSIGQPDASPPLQGGGYSLQGGFWPGASPGRYLFLPMMLK